MAAVRRPTRRRWVHQVTKPTELRVDNLVSNLGQVVRVEERGVFVVALLQSYVWSTVDGLRHVTHIEHTWHSADDVIVEVYVG